MNEFLNQVFAALAAFMLALGSIGAIFTVLPLQAANTLALPALA